MVSNIVSIDSNCRGDELSYSKEESETNNFMLLIILKKDFSKIVNCFICMLYLLVEY